MKTAILCKHCQEEFTPKRSTAIFCCDSCRTNNHLDEKKKTHNMPDKESPPPLKKDTNIESTTEKTQKYLEKENLLEDTLNFDDGMDPDEYLKLFHLENWRDMCGKAFDAMLKPSIYRIPLYKHLCNTFALGMLSNTAYLKFEKGLTVSRNLAFKSYPINKLNIHDRQHFQDYFYNQKLIAQKAIKEIEYTAAFKKRINDLISQSEIKKEDQGHSAKKSPNSLDSLTLKSPILKPDKEKIPIGKIISSTQLNDMKYESIKFKGAWSDFIGQPSLAFQCVIHGMPGEGKSTFAIQFAHYLAENFGKVIYISGEEGFNKTLRDKFFNVNAVSPDLHIADIKKYEEIYKEVKTNAYNFILIDSLDTMGINAEKLKSLREHYPKLALITISQSTKDGKIRGSNEIVHDVDIAIKVENGMAITTKNRFHEKGKKFDVFEVFNN